MMALWYGAIRAGNLDEFLIRGPKGLVKKNIKIFYYRLFYYDKQVFPSPRSGRCQSPGGGGGDSGYNFQNFLPLTAVSPPASTLGLSVQEGFAESIPTISSLSAKSRKHRRLYRWRCWQPISTRCPPTASVPWVSRRRARGRTRSVGASPGAGACMWAERGG